MGPGQASPPPTVTGAPAQAAPQVGVLPLGYMLVQQHWEPLPFRVKFDGHPKMLAYFLTQVWNYLEQYGALHPDKLSHVGAATSNLEGDAVQCLVSLYDEGSPELMDVNALMQELQYRFEDSTETC